MADEDTDTGMAKSARHVYGPRPLGALVPPLTRVAFRSHSSAATQIMIDWASIIGPAMAAVTQPRRLSDGTLTIACSGPIAMELQHLALEVVSRINTHLGRPVVRSLRFVQVGAFARPTPPPPAPPPAIAAAEAAVAQLPEGPLRDALLGLGSAVLARGRSSRPRSSRG